MCIRDRGEYEDVNDENEGTNIWPSKFSFYPSRYPYFFSSTQPVPARCQKPLPIRPCSGSDNILKFDLAKAVFLLEFHIPMKYFGMKIVVIAAIKQMLVTNQEIVWCQHYVHRDKAVDE